MKNKYSKHIFICTNTRDENSSRGDCSSCGGMEIRMRFVKLISQYGLKGKIRANKSGCLDVCEIGPAIVIYPDNIWYTQVKIDDVDLIFEKSVLNNQVVDHLSADKKTWEKLKRIRESR